MALTQEPASKVAWPPQGGEPIEVLNKGRFGESFTQIAERKNIRKSDGTPDPWRIIEFNFKTRNPKEVNWYLVNMFNCPTAADGMNCAFKGGEKIFLPKATPAPVPVPKPGEPVPPPGLTEQQVKQLAEAFDIDPSEVNRFLNQYSWVSDSALNTIGMIAEFGLMGAASEAIGAVLTLGQGVLGMAMFFLWWKRLNQEDQIALGAFAGCYQYADWVVNPKATFTGRTVRTPEFPSRWVITNFLHGTGGQIPPDKQWRYDELKQGWEAGALKMRENLEKILTDAQVKLNAELKAKANGKPVPDLTREQTEQLVKLYILTETGAIQRQYTETRGYMTANYLYKQLKPRVEEASNMKLLRNELPYPSYRLNCEMPGDICQ